MVHIGNTKIVTAIKTKSVLARRRGAYMPLPSPLNRRTGAPLPQHPFTTRQIAAPAMAPDRYEGNFCNLFPSCVLQSLLPPTPIPVPFLFRIFSSRGCQNEDWINRRALCRAYKAILRKNCMRGV